MAEWSEPDVCDGGTGTVCFSGIHFPDRGADLTLISGSPEGGAADLPRRFTADPDRFLIPAAELPAGFAERIDDPTHPAVEAKPAATVVLARDGQRGIEVLLLRRPHRSSFAANAWVFPGGRVDEADAAVDLDTLGVGPGARWWAERMSIASPSEAVGYVVAAIREAWEETGLLLAEGAGAASPARLRAGRESLLAGSLAMGDFLAREGLRLATEDLLYLAHWITPEAERRRYDTRFFLARVAPDAVCELSGEELAEARWIRPPDALNAAAAGELRLLPPTVHTLRRLSSAATLADLWSRLRDAPVPSYLPRMRRHPEGVEIVIVDS